MSHVGPLTLTQKRMLALQNGTASAVQLPHTLLPAVHDHSSSSSPHTAVDSQPLIAFGDVEMHDASAPASTAASPPSNYSHSRPQPSFSANAKPFMPPGDVNSATTTMPAAIVTPAKRPPPHRVMQAQTPSTVAPATSIPSMKTEPPASPALTESSTFASPVRRAGPHSKLSPHARKAEASAQTNALSSVQDNRLTSTQKDPTEAQQTRSDHISRINVLVPQVTAAQSESSSVSLPMSTAEDIWSNIDQLKSDPDACNGHQKAKAKAEHGHVDELSHTFNSAPPAIKLQISVESNNINHRFGSNEWLPMLFDMDEPEKGRQLIRAVADHLRASVESTHMTAATPTTDNKEILVEFSTGQCFPATVTPETTVSEMIKEWASLTHTKESDICIVLKVNVKGRADHSQASEEL